MKSINNQILHTNKDIDEGFSLIETAIALTTLGVCLAYAMPLFLYAKINNSKSEIRTGALIVSQRVFDKIRSESFATLPATVALVDGKVRDQDPSNQYNDDRWKAGTNADGTNPILVPKDNTSSSTITPQEKILTFAMGRQYRTKVIYCGDYTTDNTICTDKYRKFKVEVSFNGSKVYDLEGTYTNFQ